MSVNRPHFNIPFNPMHPKLPTPEEAAAHRAYCLSHGFGPKRAPRNPAKRPKNQLKHHWQQGHRMARIEPPAAASPAPLHTDADAQSSQRFITPPTHLDSPPANHPPLPPPVPEPILPRGGQSAAMPLTAPITQPAAPPPPAP